MCDAQAAPSGYCWPDPATVFVSSAHSGGGQQSTFQRNDIRLVLRGLCMPEATT